MCLKSVNSKHFYGYETVLRKKGRIFASQNNNSTICGGHTHRITQMLDYNLYVFREASRP